MAVIKFRIRGKNNPSPIYTRFSNGRECILERKSGYFCNPEYFNNSTGLVRNISKFSDKINLQNSLNRLENDIRNSFSTSTLFTKEWLELIISKHHGLESDIEYTLEFVMNKLIGSKENNPDYDVNQLTLKTYNTTLSRVKEFEKHIKKNYLISKVGNEFKEQFTEWAKNVAHYKPSTYRKTLKQIKTACRYAKYKMGLQIDETIFIIEKGGTFPKNDFKHPTLALHEIKNLNQFKGADYLENARDWLVISCWVGCRVSDLMKLTIKNIKKISSGELSIRYVQQKTGMDVQLPIHKDVQDIIKKHGGFPRSTSPQNYNLYIKEICEKVGMTKEMKGKKMDATTKRQIVGMFPKYQLTSSHIGRRSFATNHFGKLPNEVIMKVTGHKTNAQFLEYVGERDTDHFSDFMKYWGELENK